MTGLPSHASPRWPVGPRVRPVVVLALAGLLAGGLEAESIPNPAGPADLPSGPQNRLLTVTTYTDQLSLEQAQTTATLTLTNRGTTDLELRFRSPLVAHLDLAERLFIPLHDMNALAVRLDRLTCLLPAGRTMEIPVRLIQRRPLAAGRYRLLFPIEQPRTGRPLATGTLFLNVPPRIALAQPETIVVEAGAEPHDISCLARFTVETNVSRVRLAVGAGDLTAHGPGQRLRRLPLDRSAGAQLFGSGPLRPQSVRLAFPSGPRPAQTTGDDATARTAWTELSAPGSRGIRQEVFVRLHWRPDRRRILPCGSYQGSIVLYVMPAASP